MARNNAVTIDIGFKADMSNLYQDIKKPLDKLANLVEGSGISDAIKKEVQKSNTELQDLFGDLNKRYNELLEGKIDASSFDSFKKTTQNRLSELQAQINGLTERFNDFQAVMSGIDAGDAAQAVSLLSQRFTEFREEIVGANAMLSEFMQIANKKGTKLNVIDSSVVSDAAAEFKELDRMIEDWRSEDVEIIDEKDEKKIRERIKEIGKSIVSLRSQLDTALKSGNSADIVKLSKELYNQIHIIDTLTNSYEELTKKTYDFADIDIFKNNTGENAKKQAKWAYKYEAFVDDFLLDLEARRDEAKKNMSKQISKTPTEEIEVTEFSIKNGSISVPLKISTTEKGLSSQVNKLLEAVQSTIEPIEVKFKLTSGYKKYRTDELKDAEELQNQINNLDIPNETKQNLEQLINNIREAFGKELKINIRENSQDVKDNVKKNIQALQEELNDLPLKVSLVVDDESKKKLIKEITDVISLTEGDSVELNISEQAKQLQEAITNSLKIDSIKKWKTSFLNSIDEIVTKLGNIKIPSGGYSENVTPNAPGSSTITYQNDSIRGTGYHAGAHWEDNKFDFSKSGASKNLKMGVGMYLGADQQSFKDTYFKKGTEIKQVEYNLEKCFILTNDYISSIEDINKIINANLPKDSSAKDVMSAIDKYSRGSRENAENFRNGMMSLGYQGMYVGDYLANKLNREELVIYDEAKLDKIISFTKKEFKDLQTPRDVEIHFKTPGLESVKEEINKEVKPVDVLVEADTKQAKEQIEETTKPEEKQVEVKADTKQAKSETEKIEEKTEKHVEVVMDTKSAQDKAEKIEKGAEKIVTIKIDDEEATEKYNKLLNMMNIMNKLYEKAKKQEHAIVFNTETGYSTNIKYGPKNRSSIPNIDDLLEQAKNDGQKVNATLHTHPGVNFARLDLKDIVAAISDFAEGIRYNLVKAGNQIAIFDTQKYMEAGVDRKKLEEEYRRTENEQYEKYYKAHPETYSYEAIIKKIAGTNETDYVNKFKERLGKSVDSIYESILKELDYSKDEISKAMNTGDTKDIFESLKNSLFDQFNKYINSGSLLQNATFMGDEIEKIFSDYVLKIIPTLLHSNGAANVLSKQLPDIIFSMISKDIQKSLAIPPDIWNEIMQKAMPQMLSNLGIQNPEKVFKVTSQDKMLEAVYGKDLVSKQDTDKQLSEIEKNAKRVGESITESQEKAKESIQETAKAVIDLNNALKSMADIYSSTGKEGFLEAVNNTKGLTKDKLASIAIEKGYVKNKSEANKMKKDDLAMRIVDSYTKSLEETKKQADDTAVAIVNEGKASGGVDTSGIDKQKQALKETEEQAKKTNEVINETGQNNVKQFVEGEKKKKEVIEETTASIKEQNNAASSAESPISSGTTALPEQEQAAGQAGQQMGEQIAEGANKASDAVSNLVTVFRGISGKPFFDETNGSAWFSDVIETANTYTKGVGDLYEAKTELGNAMRVDARGANHDQIIYADTEEELQTALDIKKQLDEAKAAFAEKYKAYFDGGAKDVSLVGDPKEYLAASDNIDMLESKLQKYLYTTEQLQEIAKSKGFDSLVIDNVLDSFGDGIFSSDKIGTSIAIFNQELIKTKQLIDDINAYKQSNETPDSKEMQSTDIHEQKTAAIKQENEIISENTKLKQENTKATEDNNEANKRPKQYKDTDLEELSDEEFERLKRNANRVINNKRTGKTTRDMWTYFLENDIKKEEERRMQNYFDDSMIVSEAGIFGERETLNAEEAAKAHRNAAEAAKEHAKQAQKANDVEKDSDSNKNKVSPQTIQNNKPNVQDNKKELEQQKRYEKQLAESVKQYSSITEKIAKGKQLTTNETNIYNDLVVKINELNKKREEGVQLSEAEVKALNNVADANERALAISKKEADIQRERDVRKQLNDYMKYEGQYMRLIGKDLHGTLSDYDEEEMSAALRKMKEIESEWNDEKAKGIQLSDKQLEAIKLIQQRMANSDENGNILESKAMVNDAIKMYDALQKKIEKMYDQSEWRAEGWADQVRDLEAMLENLNPKTDVYDKSSYEEFKTALQAVRAEVQKTQKSMEWRPIAIDFQMDSRNKLYKWMEQNKRAAKEFRDELNKLDSQLEEVGNEADSKRWTEQFLAIQNDAMNRGLTGQTLGDRFKNQFANTMTSLATYYLSFQDFIRYGREAIQVIRDLDIQFTEMRKVSDESLESLKAYQIQTFDVADKLGTTAAQIQSSTADWLRLGRSFSEAKEMAALSTKLLNVSEFESINDATQSLVSATQAYKDIDPSAIVDKLNLIGNNFAVSTDELAQGLQNAAAVLMTQGNSLDEALGLLTAGNLITQDMSKTSAGIRTISLRIAGRYIPENAVMH